MFKFKICIKQKSMLFILLLISILLLTLYFQNRTSQKNYLIQLENAYKTSFDNHHKSFNQNLLNYYERVSKLGSYELNNIKALLENEAYLKEVTIQSDFTVYSKELLKKGALIDYYAFGKNIDYKIIVPIIKEQSVTGFVQYFVDTRAFLKSIKEFDGSNGLIYVMDGNQDNDVYLQEALKSEEFRQIAQSCEFITDPVFEVGESFYVKKNLYLKDFHGLKVADAVFFLDVTKEKKEYISLVRTSIMTTILLFLFAAVAVNYFFNYLINQIQKNEDALKQINKNLEGLVEEETSRRLAVEKKAQAEKSKNEQLLIQQSKLALMGEMIGNIAHQWRQPLMQLSAILMYLDAYNEKKKLTPVRFSNKMKEGNALIDFMSKTIEDFRNYYKPEKQKENFLIKESIGGAMCILSSSLKHENIQVNISYENENIELNSFKNEFSQALLNIITNAKDILLLRKIKQPQMDIRIKQINSHIIIEVQDNGGGIEREVLPKIFDPYFTTKHQAQGTGIGLYMTKMIIENNMNGKIEVENKKDGALFTIELSV